MNIDYAPPGFVTFDRVRALFYYIYLDLLSRYDMAYCGYNENTDIITNTLLAKSEGRSISDFVAESLASEKVRIVLEFPIEECINNARDIMLRIYHPLIISGKNSKPPRSINSIDIPKEHLWSHCGCTCVWFPEKFSKLEGVENILPGFLLPSTPEKTLKYFRNYLADGSIKAFLFMSDGSTKEIPAIFWNTDIASEVVSFNTLAHINISGSMQVGRVVVTAKSIVDIYYKIAKQINVTLKTENSADFDRSKSYSENGLEFIKDIMDQVRLIPQDVKAISVDKRVGAPEKYDKALFLAEAFRYMWFVTKAVPDTITDLAEAATKGYVEADGLNAPPSDKWAWNMASDLWKRMGFKGGEKAPE